MEIKEKCEMRRLKDLKLSKFDIKKYSQEEISITAKVIKRFGHTLPVLIDKEMQIIFGGHIYQAAMDLGLTEIPIIELSHLSSEEVKMYSVAINKIASMGELQLQEFQSEIKEWLFDLSLNITPEELGFSSIEIDNLLFDPQLETDEHEVSVSQLPPKVLKTVKKGDLIQLGSHKLFCGDALKEDSYASLLNEEKANIIITDPPYNVKIQDNVTKRKIHNEFKQASGEMTKEEFTEFLSAAFSNLQKCSNQGSLHYLFMDWKHLEEIQNASKSVYEKLLAVCVWNKKHGGMGSFYRSQHEFCFVYQKGKSSHKNNIQLGKNGRNRTNVWDYPGLNATNHQSRKLGLLHPTVKPLAMLVDILLDASDYGDIVLDCFGGSGSTLMAAQQCGRRARLIEISPEFCDVIIHRWEELTNQKHKILRRGE